MEITKNRIETRQGPIREPSDGAATESRSSASSVHFTPGARTAWHTHA